MPAAQVEAERKRGAMFDFLGAISDPAGSAEQAEWYFNKWLCPPTEPNRFTHVFVAAPAGGVRIVELFRRV